MQYSATGVLNKRYPARGHDVGSGRETTHNNLRRRRRVLNASEQHTADRQEPRPLSGGQGEGAGEGGIGDLVNFALGLVRRQRVVVIFTAALALALCVIYLRITPPTYTGQVEVLLGNPNKAQFVQQQSLLADQVFDPTQIETQLQIIRSRAIAVAVIKQFNLADDPDLSGSSLSLSSIWKRIRARFTSPDKAQRDDSEDQPSAD